MTMIRVRRWRPVAAWQWLATANDSRECGICQNGLEHACPQCQLPGDECPLAVGRCNHPFHAHCIVKWTAAQLEAAAANELAALEPDTGQPHCPMCRQPWTL